MKILEVLKKYWWVFPAIVVVPIVYILGRLLYSREKSKKMYEEWLRP